MRIAVTCLFVLAFWAPRLCAEEHLSKRLTAHEGETCHVCYGRVGTADAAYLANGQRVAMHSLDCCEGEFLKDPAKWMANLRPSGGILFSDQNNAALSDAWILLGIYVLCGLIFGGLSAHVAVKQGRSPVGWFFAGFLLPVAGYLYVATRPPTEEAAQVPAGWRKIPQTRDPVTCPGCGHLNHPSASRCSGCGGTLQAIAPSEVAAISGPSAS